VPPKPDTLAWLLKAAEDEQALKVLRDNGGPWSAAAYHAQQAAEKFVKAALVEIGVAPPRSHDIEFLVQLAGVQSSTEALASAISLSAFASLSRYPGGPAVSSDDVTRALSDLVTLKAWAMEAIGTSGPDPT
jgi:HEPN domain-containing protein